MTLTGHLPANSTSMEAGLMGDICRRSLRENASVGKTGGALSVVSFVELDRFLDDKPGAGLQIDKFGCVGLHCFGKV